MGIAWSVLGNASARLCSWGRCVPACLCAACSCVYISRLRAGQLVELAKGKHDKAKTKAEKERQEFQKANVAMLARIERDGKELARLKAQVRTPSEFPSYPRCAKPLLSSRFRLRAPLSLVLRRVAARWTRA